jgi:hypothetical protein
MARQLPENELVDMMLVEAIGEQIAEIRGMPGQMPGQHAMFMDLMEDDGEPRDGQAGVPLPVQGLDEDPPEGDQGQEASEGEIDVEDSEDETIAVSVYVKHLS